MWHPRKSSRAAEKLKRAVAATGRATHAFEPGHGGCNLPRGAAVSRHKVLGMRDKVGDVSLRGDQRHTLNGAVRPRLRRDVDGTVAGSCIAVRIKGDPDDGSLGDDYYPAAGSAAVG